MVTLKDKYAQILSLIPGRVRIHLPAWNGEAAGPIENALGQLSGIQSVEANPITQNVLVHFDAQSIDAETILLCLQPFGSLLEESFDGLANLDGWQLVEQLRMLATMGKLIGYFGGASRFRGAATGLAMEGSLLLLSLLGTSLGLPATRLGQLHILIDILAFGSFFYNPRPTIPPVTIA